MVPTSLLGMVNNRKATRLRSFRKLRTERLQLIRLSLLFLPFNILINNLIFHLFVDLIAKREECGCLFRMKAKWNHYHFNRSLILGKSSRIKGGKVPCVSVADWKRIPRFFQLRKGPLRHGVPCRGTLANNPRDSFSSLTTVYSQLLGACQQPYTRFVARGRQCDDDLFRSRMNGGVETK